MVPALLLLRLLAVGFLHAVVLAVSAEVSRGQLPIVQRRATNVGDLIITHGIAKLRR